MKFQLPLGFLIGPPKKKFACIFKIICGPQFLGLYPYVFIFSLLGLIMSVVDIIRIIAGGPTLSRSLWGNRLHRSEKDGCHKRTGRCLCSRSPEYEAWEARRVRPETERDMKLIASVLSAEHYFMLMVGALTCNPSLLQPWLIVGGIVLLLEAILLAIRIVMEGIHFSRGEVIICLLMLHSYLQVFCLFRCCHMTD